MGIFNFFRRLAQPQPPVIPRVETHHEGQDPVTDRQRQFLIDLGERGIPSSKAEATARLDRILAPYESGMKVCFKWWGNIERAPQRNLQIAWRNAGFADRFPQDGTRWTDEQRLEFMAFVRDTVGQQIMSGMGPLGVKEVEGKLVVKAKRKHVERKPRQIKFPCPHCGADQAVPEELATTAMTCDKCHQEILIPRPKIGYYAEPSRSQIEEAELYKVTVREGMHRGQLNEELDKARSDPARRPTTEEYERWERWRTQRRMAQAEKEIQDLRQQLNMPNLGPQQIAALKEALEEAEAHKKDIIDSEKEREREEERDRREEIREQREFRRDYFERQFNRGEDWAEFYHKPSRQQFDALYQWLDTNKPGWSGFAELTKAIDLLFPELRKTR